MRRVLVKQITEVSQAVLVWSDVRRRYVKGDRCVLLIDCPQCGSRKGEPCRGPHGYRGSTHYVRRYLINPKMQGRLLKPLSIYRDRSLWP